MDTGKCSLLNYINSNDEGAEPVTAMDIRQFMAAPIVRGIPRPPLGSGETRNGGDGMSDEIKVGQIYRGGHYNVPEDGFILTLSADTEYLNADDKERVLIWEAAEFPGLSPEGLFGAKIRQFTEDEVREFEYFGMINFPVAQEKSKTMDKMLIPDFLIDANPSGRPSDVPSRFKFMPGPEKDFSFKMKDAGSYGEVALYSMKTNYDKIEALEKDIMNIHKRMDRLEKRMKKTEEKIRFVE